MSREQSPVDFVNIFNQRMQAVVPYPPQTAREIALLSSEVELDLIRKKLPAVVFVATQENRIWHTSAIKGIWVEPADSLKSRHRPHGEVVERMKKVFEINNLTGGKVSSALVFEDGKGDRHLVLDFEGSLEVDDEREHNKKAFEDLWVGLAREYRLSSIAGPKPIYIDEEDRFKFVTSDLIGKLREEEYILSFATERQMTNFQWLRFRALALGAKKSGISVVYSELANDIILQDK
jgi:hypothetical protein